MLSTARRVRLDWGMCVAVLCCGITSLSFGCGPERRAGNDDVDLKEARQAAERYMKSLQNQRYDDAIALTTKRLQSVLFPQVMKKDVEGRFGGAPIRDWTLESERLVHGATRGASFLYRVRGGTVTRLLEVDTELVSSPWRWQIASVTNPNDETATANAKEAEKAANSFLQKLKARDFSSAFNLLSPWGQSGTSPKKIEGSWQLLEHDEGIVRGWELKKSFDTTEDIGGKRRPFTMLFFRIDGSKGTGGGMFTMFKGDGGWQVVGIDFQMDVPSWIYS